MIIDTSKTSNTISLEDEISRITKKKESLSGFDTETFIKVGVGMITGYLYLDTLQEQWKTEDTFYYANARAAGRIMKYTLPLVFLPILRMLNSYLAVLKIFQHCRVSIHRMLGYMLLVFSMIHTLAHVSNKYPNMSIMDHESMTGVGMLGVAFIPILGSTQMSSRVTSNLNHFLRFLLPHQLGALLLIGGLAFHTKDLRLLPLSMITVLGYLMDRMSEVKSSHNTSVNEINKIHGDMALVSLERPYGYKFKAGDFAYLSSSHSDQFINNVHPFTIAGKPNDYWITFLISSKGPWTKNLLNEVHPRTPIRLSPALSSSLNVSLEKIDNLMLITTGSGLAMTLSFMEFIESSKKIFKSFSVFHSTRQEKECDYLLNKIAYNSHPIEPCQFYVTGKTDNQTRKDIIKGRMNLAENRFFRDFKGHVFFCGAPKIGEQLKELCSNDPEKYLHVENF